jgi:hypothetical protein
MSACATPGSMKAFCMSTRPGGLGRSRPYTARSRRAMTRSITDCDREGMHQTSLVA